MDFSNMKCGAKGIIPMGKNGKGAQRFLAVARDYWTGLTNPGQISLPHGNGGFEVEHLVKEARERLGIETHADDWVKIGEPVVNTDSVDKNGFYTEATQYYRLRDESELKTFDLSAIGFAGVVMASKEYFEALAKVGFLSPPVAAALRELPPETWA